MGYNEIWCVLAPRKPGTGSAPESGFVTIYRSGDTDWWSWSGWTTESPSTCTCNLKWNPFSPSSRMEFNKADLTSVSKNLNLDSLMSPLRIEPVVVPSPELTNV